VYRPFNKKILYKDSPLRVYRQEPSLENSLDQPNHALYTSLALYAKQFLEIKLFTFDYHESKSHRTVD